MSRYVQNWIFETVFDGDDVKATLRPLEQIDLLRFSQLGDDSGNVKVSTAAARAFYSEILPKYCTKIEGLVDAAGAAIDTPIVARDAYFFPLAAQIGLELVGRASPSNPTPPGGSRAPGLPGQP